MEAARFGWPKWDGCKFSMGEDFGELRECCPKAMFLFSRLTRGKMVPQAPISAIAEPGGWTEESAQTIFSKGPASSLAINQTTVTQ